MIQSSSSTANDDHRPKISWFALSIGLGCEGLVQNENQVTGLKIIVMDGSLKLLFELGNGCKTGVTFSPYFTFTPPYFLYDYLIPLVQGHMAIHAALS